MIRRVRFSPALFIACLALTVALGGVSYAAVSLPKNSVTSKQVKDHSLKKRDLASGASTIKGPRPKTIRGVLAVGGDSDGMGELFTDSVSFVFTLALPPAVNRSRGRRPTDRGLPVSRSSRSCRRATSASTRPRATTPISSASSIRRRT